MRSFGPPKDTQTHALVFIIDRGRGKVGKSNHGLLRGRSGTEEAWEDEAKAFPVFTNRFSFLFSTLLLLFLQDSPLVALPMYTGGRSQCGEYWNTMKLFWFKKVSCLSRPRERCERARPRITLVLWRPPTDVTGSCIFRPSAGNSSTIWRWFWWKMRCAMICGGNEATCEGNQL